MAMVKIQYISLSTCTCEIELQIELLALWKWPLGISEINKFTWHHNRSPYTDHFTPQMAVAMWKHFFVCDRFLQVKIPSGKLPWIRHLNIRITHDSSQGTCKFYHWTNFLIAKTEVFFEYHANKYYYYYCPQDQD